MTEQNTGGAAFPLHSEVRPALDHDWCGMTLRDYFAAHAPEPYKEWRGGSRGLMDIVEWRWFYADAMLKVRQS